MSILALDIGDVWTGSAIADPLGITARPYQTTKTTGLDEFLIKTIEKEHIDRIVVGYPKTLKGTESAQTKKVVAHKEELEKKFKNIEWVLWDERLSSKQAAAIKKSKSEEKTAIHSKAAAFILMGYLDHLAFQKNSF